MSLPPSSTIRAALGVVGVLGLFGAVLIGGLSVTVGAQDEPTPGGSPPTTAPPTPAPGEPVGVLGLDGRPLTDLDGEVLELPLDAGSPPAVPATSGGSEPTDAEPTDAGPTAGIEAETPASDAGSPVGESVESVTVLEAHTRTVVEAARQQGYGPAATLRLLAANRLLVAVDAAGAGIDELGHLLETGACADLGQAAAGVDGVAPDLVGGLAGATVADLVGDLAREAGC